MKCPYCKTPLPTENINITENLGKCDTCGMVLTVSEHVKPIDYSFNLNWAPEKCDVFMEGEKLIIDASTRSYEELIPNIIGFAIFFFALFAISSASNKTPSSALL